METEFKSTHELSFEAADYHFGKLFRVGTVNGLWYSTEDSYVIISLINNDPGNGHLSDVFEWFENSCRRDNKNLLVVEIMNQRFKNHLIFKKGFLPLDEEGENVIKIFNKEKFHILMKNGNELIQAGTMKCN